jgi:hypothetical protein
VKSTSTAIESRLGYIRSGGRSGSDGAATAMAMEVPGTPPQYPAIEKVARETIPCLRAASDGRDGNGGMLSGPEHRPRTAAELGIRRAVVDDLAIKTLYLSGTASARDLARQMRLSVNVADELVGRMRSAQVCQVTGMTGNLPTVTLTDQGRKRGLELLAQSQYAGAAPVSLESYVTQVRKQSVRNLVVRKADVERAFGELIIDPKVLGQIGTGSTPAHRFLCMDRRAWERRRLRSRCRGCWPRTMCGFRMRWKWTGR